MSQGFDAKYAVRDDLIDRLRADLVGPSAEDETLVDAPFSTYVAGVLYPRTAAEVEPEDEVDEHDDDGEATYADPPVSLANSRYPSSLGMTFAVDRRASLVKVRVEAARYENQGSESEPRWTRIPLSFDHEIDLRRPAGDSEVELEAGLGLYVRTREADGSDGVPVTIVAINRRLAPKFEKDSNSYFQVRLTAEGDDAPFVERDAAALPVNDADLESYRLIYRDVRNFAVGHGTSVEWDLGVDRHRAETIRTAAVPAYELPLADSNQTIDTSGLGMERLASEDRAATVAALRRLADDYERWIDARGADREALAGELQGIAGDHLKECRDALARIHEGIDLIDTVDDVWRAFRLSNLAMGRQRARAAWISGGKEGPAPEHGEGHRWRPFQIAFILLNLSGTVDPEHRDRDVLDLLWFPTGGGKTEAYLGLIGITVMLRRLRHGDAGGGVTVLMRYTLRLLTIQQFERASALMCALEAIRQDEGGLGRVPISIGLWVGRNGTPSTVQEARTALDRLRVNQEVEAGNPVQVRACPWCGTKLDHRAYWIAKSDPRLVISCRDKHCRFNSGLPIHVVDEDLYRERPTLVIGTADKFATLPWVKGAFELFGVGSAVKPPELIVQDELHLISGPLGTLAGLYESAIDLLCTDRGVRPKVIASTATIRRAADQTKALFDREMRQFPPPGLDAGDSFFSVTADRGSKPARLYVGAMAPGTSQSTLMIRAYAALLQGAQDVDAADADRDPYWTLVGYFNSLRVLGGARIQVLDDVRDRMQLVAAGDEPRELDKQIELTSREPSSVIPGHLQSLDVAYPHEEALDYVLATNMISVGVDIDRLGLMVVMGQPQATAEYIQATSRVGRQHPGIVLTLYNAGRSRDRSHYESFTAYHAALYRQVESTSVTPFSPRARDRALHAVLLALARTAVPALRENAAARDVEKHLPELRAFADQITDRAERVEPGSGPSVRKEFEAVLDKWVARAREAPKLVYANPRDAVNSLLSSADEAEGEGFPTPSSLRDVDGESNLYLVRV
ncbi:helicase-related protein [Patulibacter americanus]|uniref:helicase-related protein n=1 Tax=Patulibacter americanus TaxID=588672 RepID=UPI0003B69C01|nr:helicase-related protein [Patulibacter americanus]